jgi:hypothetical protein
MPTSTKATASQTALRTYMCTDGLPGEGTDSKSTIGDPAMLRDSELSGRTYVICSKPASSEAQRCDFDQQTIALR